MPLDCEGFLSFLISHIPNNKLICCSKKCGLSDGLVHELIGM